MRWVITGGCGFLGKSLIRHLLNQGEQDIRVVDNLSVGTRENLASVTDFKESSVGNAVPNWSGVELTVSDIKSSADALALTRGTDVIVHLAANTGVGPSVEDPRSDCETNVFGTLNYLEGARINNVGTFVFASSGAPAGEVDPPIHEELAPHPVSPYGASKLAGEGYCSAYAGSFGVKTVSLRFGNIYGPGSNHKGSVVAKFFKDAMSSRQIEIYGDGAQTRDFIFIDDLIRAILLAVQHDGPGGDVFQIAANTETTIMMLASKVCVLLEEYGIVGTSIKHGKPRKGDVKRNFSDISKARKVLGWAPEYTLDVGLRRTLEYFLNLTKQQE